MLQLTHAVVATDTIIKCSNLHPYLNVDASVQDANLHIYMSLKQYILIGVIYFQIKLEFVFLILLY